MGPSLQDRHLNGSTYLLDICTTLENKTLAFLQKVRMNKKAKKRYFQLNIHFFYKAFLKYNSFFLFFPLPGNI